MPSSASIIGRVLIPFALGYFLSYFYRVVNAVIAPALVDELALTPSDLGLLTASYFISFAAFQLPLGVLLDRVGPRKVEATLLLFAAAGSLLFSLAETSVGLILARALIGLGVSACLMAAFKSFVIWFPPERLPMVNGLQMACGGLGALAATAPVGFAVDLVGWRIVFAVLAFVTMLVAATILLAVPERKTAQPQSSLGAQVRGIAEVYTSRFFWRVAPVTVASQASFLAIQGLWVGPWLRDVAGMTAVAVGDTLFLIAALMVAGFIVNGLLVERLARLGLMPLPVSVAGMTLFMSVQALIIAEPVAWAIPVWLLFGYFGTAGIIPYAVLSQRFPKALAGRANTALNLLVFVAAFCAQWGIGAVIDLWPVGADGGYTPAGYQAALIMMLGFQCLALAWFVAAGFLYRTDI